MQTREELLNDLGEAVNIIRRLAKIQEQLNWVRSQYRNTKRLKKFSILGKIIIAFWFIFLFFVLMSDTHSQGIEKIILFMCGLFMWVLPNFLFFYFRKKRRNEKIVEENQEIVARNKQLGIQEQKILFELQQVQVMYRNRIGSWYPMNYCSVDAVEFFYNAINNYRADNLKEAINLYEMTLHQRRMEANQRQAIREQQLSNLLSAENLAMQKRQLDAINYQTASINSGIESINRAYRGY